MLELLLLIMVIVPLVLVSYRIGRKNKKSEMNTVSLLVLGAVFSSVIIYILLHCNIRTIFTFTKINDQITDFDY